MVFWYVSENWLLRYQRRTLVSASAAQSTLLVVLCLQGMLCACAPAEAPDEAGLSNTAVAQNQHLYLCLEPKRRYIQAVQWLHACIHVHLLLAKAYLEVVHSAES